MPTVARAQAVVDPHTAEFSPSSDHSRNAADGTPLVSRYDLGFYLSGAALPFQVQSLGKPAPAADGLIHFNLSGLSSMPSPGVVYESRVSSVGPGGTGTSQVSNTFMFSVPCSFSATPATQAMLAGGGSGTVAVVSASGCAWTAASNSSWLTISAGATGSGSGSVTFAAAANGSTTARTGTLTVAGQTITVSQVGVACTYGASPATQNISDTAGSAAVAVTAAAGCTWTATRSGSWLTITSGGEQMGNGTVNLSASANTLTTPRTGTVTVGGQTVSIVQGGAPCTFTASPTSQSFSEAAGTGSVSVTAAGGCAWTATSGASWLTISGGASGSGNGTTSYAVAANTSITPRTGTLTVAGQLISVTRPG